MMDFDCLQYDRLQSATSGPFSQSRMVQMWLIACSNGLVAAYNPNPTFPTCDATIRHEIGGVV
jgi:hypothetical protein